MKKIFITFDSYYSIKEYNSFITAARNNEVELEEYIRVRSPYKRFLKLNSKDVPSFVNYDIASTSDIKWLVSCVKPVQPNEAYKLRRREGQDISYFNYITPEPLQDAHKKKYIMVFKAMGFSQIQDISSKLGNIKIYKWGTSINKKYDIYYCYNSYIKGVVHYKDVLMEFGKEADSGIKRSPEVPKNKGDLEYYLNYFVLITEKLENKTLKAEEWSNGKITPLKKTSFI